MTAATKRNARRTLLASTALIAAAAALPAQAQTQIASPQHGGAIAGAGAETVEDNTPAGGGIFVMSAGAPITFTDVTIANTTGAGPTVGQAANAIGLVNTNPTSQSITLNGSNSFATTQAGGTAFRAQTLNGDLTLTLNGGTQRFSGTDGLHLRAMDAIDLVNNGGPLTISATGGAGVYSRANNGAATLNLGTVSVAGGASTGIYAYGYAGANVTTGGGTISALTGIDARSAGVTTIVSGSTIIGTGTAQSVGITGFGESSSSARFDITSNGAISNVNTGIYFENRMGLAGNVIRVNASIDAVSAGIDTGSSTATDIHVGSDATVQGGVSGIARSSAGTTNNGGTVRGGVGITSTVASSVVNSGLIQGSTFGVNFLAGGTLTNNAGATINGGGSGGNGVNVAGAAGTIDNRGTIGVGNAAGIMLNAGGTATNYGTINASGNNSTGLRSTGAASTLDNRGTITANIGIRTDASGSTLNNSGTINSTSFAIYVPSGTATLTNSGSVNGAIGATLNGGGSITNTGSLIGVSYGITSAGAATTVVNSGTISGGSGAISLSAYNDVVTLNPGSVTIGSISLSSGDDTLNIMTGATFGALAGGAGTDTLVLGGTTTGTLDLANVATFEILNKVGSGTWTLNGAAASPAMVIGAGNGTPSGTLVFNGSGLTGAITVNGAILRATSAGAFGTGRITAIDPTIQYGATGTYTNQIILASADPTNDPTRLEADSGVVATLTGQLLEQGTGQPLVIGGSGTIVLTNQNNFWSGGTRILAGATLQGMGTALGNGYNPIANDGTIIFDETGTYTQIGAISGSGGVVKRGSGMLLYSSANNYAGATTIEAGTLQLTSVGALSGTSGIALTGATAVLDNNSSDGAVLNNLSGVAGSQVLLRGKSTTLANSANTIFAGTLSGTSSGGITKAGSGTLTLSGNNSGLTAPLLISAGTIALIDAGSLASAGYIAVNGGGFDISGVGGTGTSINDLRGSGGSVILGDKRLTIVNGSYGNSYAGVISGTGGVTLSSGIATLAGANSYSGTTVIASGAQLNLSGAGSLANSDVTANGFFQLLNADATVRSLSGGSPMSATFINGNTLTVTHGGTYAGQLNGSGTLSLTGGTFVYTGSGGPSTIALNGGNFTLGDGGTSGYVSGTPFVLNAGTLTINHSDNYAVGYTGGAGNFVQAGTGLTQLWHNTWTGTTTAAAGILQLNYGDAIADTSDLIVLSGATAQLFGGSETVGSLSGAGVFDLNGNGLTLGNGGNFSGLIRDSYSSGSLSVLAGTLTLAGDSSFAGTTYLHGDANLTLGNGGTSGSLAGLISFGTGTLTINRSDGMTINGLLGAGRLVQAGAGTTHLSGTGGFTGATVIEAGTLFLDDGQALRGSSSVALDGAGSVLDASATATSAAINNLSGVSGSVVRVGISGLALSTTQDTNFAGTFDAPAPNAINFGGTATLTLTGQSDVRRAGIASGTLAMSGAGTLGSSTDLQMSAGATLDLTARTGGTYALANLGGAGGTVKLGNNVLAIGNAVSGHDFGGAIQGSGGVHLSGGNWGLAAGQAYTGATTIDAGATLALFGAGSFASGNVAVAGTLDLQRMSDTLTLATLSGAGTITLGNRSLVINGNGGQSDFAGTVTGGTGGVTIGSGTQRVTTNWTNSGTTRLLGDASLILGNGGTGGSVGGPIVLEAGTLTVDRSDVASINGLGGGGTFVQAGTGTTLLTNAYGFTGDAVIQSGTLSLNDSTSFSNVASVSLTGAGTVLKVGQSGFGATNIHNLSGVAGSTVLIGSKGLYVGSNASTMFAGTLDSLGGDLTLGGPETLTLTGWNALNRIDLNSGTLALAGNGRLGDTARLFLQGGTLDASGVSTQMTQFASLGGDRGIVALGGARLTLLDANDHFGGTITGTGGLTIAGGNLMLTGASSYSGDTVIDSGATLALRNTFDFNTGDVLTSGSIANSAVTVNGFFDLGNLVGNARVASLSGGGSVQLGFGDLDVGGDNADTSFSGAILGPGRVRKEGTGTWTLSGQNELSRLLVFDGTVALAGDGTIGADAEVAIAFGSLDISGITADSLAIGDLSDNGAVHLGGKTLEITNGYQVYGGVMDGTGGVHILGGDGQFSATQLYTGTTTVDAGAGLYLLGFDGGLTGAAQIDGTLDISLHAGAARIGGLSGSGTVLLGANSLTLTGGGSFSGEVSGDGGLIFAAGSSTLAGANSYAGTTRIDTGATLALTGTVGAGAVIANGAFDISGAAGDVTIANLSGGGTVALGTNDLMLGGDNLDSLFSGVIGGSGGLVKTGTGVLTLSGANRYTGLTSVQDGTLRLGAAGVLADDSTLEVLNGATLDMNGFDETVASFTIRGNLVGAGTLTAALYNFLGGTIDHDLGGGAIHQISGTTLLNGSSAGSAVHVEGGALVLGADDRLADTALVTIASGATLDLQGFADTVGSLALAGVLNGTGTLTAGTYALDGALVNANLGIGTLVQHSGLSLLNGTAATEVVRVDGGTLRLGASDRLADTSAVAVGTGATLDLQGYSDTVASLALGGTLAGTGTLTAGTYSLDSATVGANLGAGTLVQHSGTSFLSGSAAAEVVRVDGGTLRLGASDRLADTAAVTVADGATLALQGYGDTIGTLALAGTLSGTGTLSAGTYALDGATVGANLSAGTLVQRSGTSFLNGSAAAGNVRVDGGTLRLGASDRLADTAAVTVANGATLALQGFSDTVGTLALAGTLSGTGTLAAGTYTLDSATLDANLGAGTLIQRSGISLLNGTTAAQAVEIDGGTLRLGGSNRLADNALIMVASGTTLDLQGFSDTIGSLALSGTLSGAGTLSAARYTLNGATVNANLAGGTLAQASGTSILAGTATGTNAVIAGGTLRIGNGGTAGWLTGDVAVNGALVFDRSDAVTYAGALSGNGSVSQAQGSLTLSGGSGGFGGTFTASGAGLAVTGQFGNADAHLNVASGTLSGAGSIGGTVTLADGAHLAGISGSTLSMGALVLGSGSMVDITLGQPSTSALFAIAGDLTLDGTLNVATQPGYGTGIYRLFSYGGALTDKGLALGTGTGDLFVQTANAGQVNLVNSSGVTLSFWDGGIAANHDNGRIEGGSGAWSLGTRNWTDANGALNGPMQPVPGFAVFQGNGSTVTIDNGAGQVGATGMQFAVSGYTLAGGALALSGEQAIVRVGDGTAAGAGIGATIASALTGAAALVKTDLGTLTLTGANSYAGGTIVQAGTLIGNAASIRGNVQNAGTVVFDQAGNASFAGTTGGAGGYVKSGAGALTLTAASSGNWRVTGGSLVSTSTLFTGNLDLGAGTSFVFDQAVNGSYAGTLTGAGSVLFRGGGTVLLTGNSAGFAGVTTIGSLLSVNGTLGGTIDVLAGGRLQGNGTIGASRIAGTIAPGNSIGTLTVAGNLSFLSGSTYEVEANASGQSDKIVVNGSASIQSGAVVSVLAADGNSAVNTSYTILTATGGLTGTFSSVTSNLAFLTPSLAYGANAVTLSLKRNTIDFASVAQTRNQRGVGPAVEALGLGNTVYDAVVALTAPEARAAFDQLSGSDYASMRGRLLDDSRFAREAMLARGDLAGEEGLSVWGTALGNWGSMHHGALAQGYDRDLKGFLAGFDAGFGGHWRAGLVTGYDASELRTGNATHKADTYHAGGYLAGSYGIASVQLGAAYAWNDVRSQRRIGFGGLHQGLGDRYHANTAQVFGEVAVKGELGGVALQPFAGLAWVRLQGSDIAEQGGAAALHGGQRDQSMTYGSFGLRTNMALGGGALRFKGSAALRHAFGDTVPMIDLGFATGPGFVTAGNALDRDNAVVDAGLELDLARHVTLGISYAGSYGTRATDHGARAALSWRF